MKKILILLFALFAMLFTGCMSTGSTENEVALIEAAREGNTARVKELIAQGVNLEPKGSGSDTALITAAENGHTQIVEVLLDAGANINAKDLMGTALINATRKGHTEIVKILIEAGADIEATGLSDGTALSDADDIEIAKMLIEAGADVNAKDEYGLTAIISDAHYGNMDMVELLIANGAEFNAIINSSNPALKVPALLLPIVLGGGTFLEARTIYNSYESIQGDNLLDNMKSLQEVLDDTMAAYSRIWSTGIELSVDGFLENGTMPLFLTTEACNTNGANALLDERFQVIIDKVKVLDKTDYSNTLKCYAILAEYKSLIQNISGSFNDFNPTKARLNSEFQQAMALAVLE